jgi:hypothetical protein
MTSRSEMHELGRSVGGALTMFVSTWASKIDATEEEFVIGTTRGYFLTSDVKPDEDWFAGLFCEIDGFANHDFLYEVIDYVPTELSTNHSQKWIVNVFPVPRPRKESS